MSVFPVSPLIFVKRARFRLLAGVPWVFSDIGRQISTFKAEPYIEMLARSYKREIRSFKIFFTAAPPCFFQFGSTAPTGGIKPGTLSSSSISSVQYQRGI